MPWCPKCKNEYRDGITVCADCQVALVDILPHAGMDAVLTVPAAPNPEKFFQYLAYSKISYESDYDETEGVYRLFASKKESKKLLNAYRTYVAMTEAEELVAQSIAEAETQTDDSDAPISEDNESETLMESDEDTDDFDEELEEAENAYRMLTSSSTPYEQKSGKYQDMQSSAIMLLGFGICGLLLYVLPIDIVRNSSPFTKVIMGAFFVALIAFGISSLRTAKRYRAEADQEEALLEAMRTWLKENVTKESLATQGTADLSEGDHFFTQVAAIKKALAEQFAERQPEESLLDYVAEEHYNSLF